MDFLGVFNVEDMHEFKADGLLGLAPSRYAENSGNNNRFLDRMKE